MSKNKLEQRFGAYQPAKNVYRVEPQFTYAPLPLGDEPIFNDYLKSKLSMRDNLFELYQATEDNLKQNELQWQRKRQEIDLMPLAKIDRYSLIKYSWQQEKKERKRIIEASCSKAKEFRKVFPYKSWAEFKKNEVKAYHQLASISNEPQIQQQPPSLHDHAPTHQQLPSLNNTQAELRGLTRSFCMPHHYNIEEAI